MNSYPIYHSMALDPPECPCGAVYGCDLCEQCGGHIATLSVDDEDGLPMEYEVCECVDERQR